MFKLNDWLFHSLKSHLSNRDWGLPKNGLNSNIWRTLPKQNSYNEVKIIMKIVQWLQNTSQYLFQGVTRLFSPTDDNYPKSGVQAFHGDPPKDGNQY